MTGADVDAYSSRVQTPASFGLGARFPLRRPLGVPRHFGILAILGSDCVVHPTYCGNSNGCRSEANPFIHTVVCRIAIIITTESTLQIQ